MTDRDDLKDRVAALEKEVKSLNGGMSIVIFIVVPALTWLVCRVAFGAHQ